MLLSEIADIHIKTQWISVSNYSNNSSNFQQQFCYLLQLPMVLILLNDLRHAPYPSACGVVLYLESYTQIVNNLFNPLNYPILKLQVSHKSQGTSLIPVKLPIPTNGSLHTCNFRSYSFLALNWASLWLLSRASLCCLIMLLICCCNSATVRYREWELRDKFISVANERLN